MGMEIPGCSHTRIPLNDIAAVPRGDNPTRTTNDGNNWQDIPRIHDGIEHDVSPTAGKQQIPVAVAPCTEHFRFVKQIIKSRSVLIFTDTQNIRCQQDCLGKRVGFWNTYRMSVNGCLIVIADAQLL